MNNLVNFDLAPSRQLADINLQGKKAQNPRQVHCGTTVQELNCAALPHLLQQFKHK
jgi:hypothetical protein